MDLPPISPEVLQGFVKGLEARAEANCSAEVRLAFLLRAARGSELSLVALLRGMHRYTNGFLQAQVGDICTLLPEEAAELELAFRRTRLIELLHVKMNAYYHRAART